MGKGKVIVFAAAAAVAASAGIGFAKSQRRDFVLVEANGPVACVVLPDQPEEATRLAATELTNYVFKIARREMPVMRIGEVPRKAPRVVIGTLKTAVGVPQSIRKRLDATDNPEAACVATDGDTLWIVGKDEVADLYATYHFLESKLGVRWFQAATEEDPGEYVPNMQSIKIAPFAKFREPRFRIRRLDKCGATGKISVNAETCAVRNGYQVFPPYESELPYDKPDSPVYKFYAPRCPRRSVSFGGGHTTFSQPMPVKTAFKEHPEYFALVDGKRVQSNIYCFSNPEVQRITADYVTGKFDKYNGDGEFLFGMADVTHGWCECDKCLALDSVPAFSKYSETPNVSTRFNVAAKNMADMIWAKWPKANLSLWAYHTYRIPPVGVRIDPRMKVQFCDHSRCYGHHIDDPNCKRNVDMLNLMKGWLKLAPRVYTYEYFTCSRENYSCHEKDEAHDLRYYASLGVMGWKNEAAFSDSVFWPLHKGKSEDLRKEHFPSIWQWLYLTSKMLWDPFQDEDAILDDAESKYYGAAYPAMKKYHAIRRKLWMDSPVCMGYPWRDPRRPTLLSKPGTKEKLLALLDEADRLAAGDRIVARRVGRDRTWLRRYWIEPNEKAKAKAESAFRAVKATMPITIDGNGDEGAWTGAYYADKLYGKTDKAEVDASLATSFGILYDDDNLYFLVTAKEPEMPALLPKVNGPAWDGDSVDIFLYPPEIDNRYYRITASPAGKASVQIYPEGGKAANFGVKAAGRSVKGGWQLELKVPTGKMHALKAGETWRVLLCRNRRRRGAEGVDSYSTDACEHDDTAGYHTMEIGSAYLVNGSFAELDKDGKPVGWSLSSSSRVVSAGKGNAVVLGRIFQTMAHGVLGQKPVPRRLRYEFFAKGPGKIVVSFFRYANVRDPKTGKGERKILKTMSGGSYTLTDKAALYSGEYEIAADEWCAIALSSADDATVYSVSVTPLR